MIAPKPKEKHSRNIRFLKFRRSKWRAILPARYTPFSFRPSAPRPPGYAGGNALASWFKRTVFISVLMIVTLFPFSSHASDILLGTGESGTFSYFAGRTLCRILNHQSSSMNCATAPASGDVSNLTNLLGGSLDIALIDSRVLHDAVNKTGEFEFLDISYDNLRALIPFYEIPITLAVRSDAGITSLETAKGKRINAGAPRSPQHFASDMIIKAKGWSKSDFSLVQELPASQSQDTMAFCHGTIQAMFHIGVHPDSSLQQLFKLCKADTLDMADSDIEKLVNEQPAFWKIEIAAGTYPSHPEKVTTFGTRMMLVVSEDLDEETAYQIIDALFKNRKRLKNAHPALSPFALNTGQSHDAGIPLHAGAAKYFSTH